MAEAIGHLSLGVIGTKGDGKLIDTWSFASPDRAVAAAKIEVYLVKKGGATVFVARCPIFPQDGFSDTDIEVLREDVAAYCGAHFAKVAGVQWEDWLEVQARGGDRVYSGTGGERLEIAYRHLKRGRHPSGEAHDITLVGHGVAVPFPTPKRSGDDENARLNAGLKDGSLLGWRSGRDTNTEFSYLPDTAENRVALDQLMANLRLLRDRLNAFLGQDHIGHAVLALREQALSLPAPPCISSRERAGFPRYP